jgi:hypothetical protein
MFTLSEQGKKSEQNKKGVPITLTNSSSASDR